MACMIPSIVQGACVRFRLAAIEEARRASVYQAAIRTPLVRLDLPFARSHGIRHRDFPQARIAAADWVVQDPRRVERRARAAARAAGGGVWTVSAGNAAQGVAFAARRAGAPCSVMVMDTAPQTKIDAIERLGATHRPRHLRRSAGRTVEQHGSGSHGRAPSCIRSTTIGSSPATARRASRSSRTCPTWTPSSRRSAAAGLLAGIGAGDARAKARRQESSRRSRKPQRRCRRRSRAARPATSTRGRPRSSMARAASRCCRRCGRCCSALVDDSIVVTLEEVRAAMKRTAERVHVIAEGAAACAVAAALSGTSRRRKDRRGRLGRQHRSRALRVARRACH